MFRKLSIIVALFMVLAFGGAFNQVDASANQKNEQAQYKVFYSINGEKGSVSNTDVNQFIRQAIERLQYKWQTKAPAKQSDKVVQAPKNQVEKPKQPENVVEQPAPVEKKEEPKQEVVKENPVVEKEQPKEEQTVQPAEPQEEEKVTGLSQFEVEVVELTNKERTQQGLQALQIDEELSGVAREKSRDMASNRYFDHNSPTYGSPFDMMKSYGINYRTAGENIAKGQRTPAEVVNAWMNSPGHRANILNGNFTHIGVGYLEQGNHWTQMFIGK